MLNSPSPFHTSRARRAGGFTLVELLVVIGIIAILAGVALGPITGGLRKAKQNVGMQNARTIALSEFQYSVDNDSAYPDKNGGDASDIAKALMAGGYISDPTLFFTAGSAETKYAGVAPSTGLTKTNISWDFAGAKLGAGVSTNTPDQMPVVWSCLSSDPALATVGAISPTLATTNPYSTQGMAVCFKSNSAKFIVVKDTTNPTVALTDASYPGWANYAYLPGGG